MILIVCSMQQAELFLQQIKRLEIMKVKVLDYM